MTENFQQCSHLEIGDDFSKSTNTLSDLMTLQKNIQENVYGYNFESIQETVGSVKTFVDWNYAAIQDEFREFYNALGGVHSHGAASWKPWKSAHKECLAKPFSDLTEEEKKELHMEGIDILHFVFNIFLATGMTPEMVFNYYLAKNKENIARQSKGNY